MSKRTQCWLTAVILLIALALGQMQGDTKPRKAHAQDFTPTPTMVDQPDDPGGHGGTGY